MPFTIRSIQWQWDVRAPLEVWRESLPGDPIDRHALALVYLEAFHEKIVASRGAPPAEGVVDLNTVPPSFWLELTGGWWAHCAVVERKRGPFPAIRTVKVVNLVSRPRPGKN